MIFNNLLLCCPQYEQESKNRSEEIEADCNDLICCLTPPGCTSRSMDREYHQLPLKAPSLQENPYKNSYFSINKISEIFGTVSNFLSEQLFSKSESSPPLSPEGVSALTSLSYLQAHITFMRYKNEDLIWGGPKGINYGNFVGAEPDDVGNLYPSHNTYFDADIWLPPGTSLTLNGQYPHSRYDSVTVANILPNGLGNGQFLNGCQIQPNQGSLNPYDPKNTRDVSERNFTIQIVQEDPPKLPHRKHNTIYVGKDKGGKRIKLRLRIYVPDIHYDGTGVEKLKPEEFASDLSKGVIKQGTGLPVATLNWPDGKTESGPSLLKTLRARKNGDPAGYDNKQWLELVENSSDPKNAPCMREPVAQRFWNTDYSVTGAFIKDPELRVKTYPATDDGGFSNNPNTGYLFMSYSFAFGEVLVIRAKMPTHPKTRRGEKTLPEDPQVQYFSLSTANDPSNGRGNKEIFDETFPLDKKGFFTTVVCWPENRPVNATLRNKVVWLDPGYGEGRSVGSRIWTGTVYARYMDPSLNWMESPMWIPEPTEKMPIPQDKRVMKEFYLRTKYMSKKDFEEEWPEIKAEMDADS